MDPLLLFALALFTAFVLGRASARATWRRVREERLYLAGFQAVAERWRQTAAPLVADWPTALPAGDGVRELTARAVFEPPRPGRLTPGWQPALPGNTPGQLTPELDAAPVRSGGPAVGRHRRYVWVGFWAASVTPRDPQARIAAALAACPAPPSPGAGQMVADAAAVERATRARPRELVGAAS